MIAAHAALLAWKSGRPVKLVYDRAEDMVATTKRHPSRTRHRTVVDRDGTLARDGHRLRDRRRRVLHAVARRAVARHDSRGRARTSVPTCALRGRAVATSTPPHGAFRGFGAPQSFFALERHMDVVAASDRTRAGRASPAEFHQAGPDERRRSGDARAGRDGVAARPRARAVRLSREGRALRATTIRQPRSRKASASRRSCTARALPDRARSISRRSSRSRRRPRAASACWPPARKSVRARTRSSRRLRPTRSASTTTTLTSRSRTPRVVPNSGPTVASRTCMVVGQLVEMAARALKQPACSTRDLLSEPYTAAEFTDRVPASTSTTRGAAPRDQPLRAAAGHPLGRREVPGRRVRRLRLGGVRRGSDRRHTTYETRVDDFVAVQEIGRVIHPVLAAGQIEGGVAQAIGYALYETSSGATAAWPTRR